MIRVMVVDDHRLVRTGLRRLLDGMDDITVVAEAATGEEALQRARETDDFDLVLMDVNLPGIGGLEATSRLLASHPQLKVIVVSMHEEEPYPSRMLAAGASGYLSKDCSAEELATAVRTVMDGRHYVGPGIAGALAASLVQGARQSPFEQLSQREMQVMLMVTRGHSIQSISESLHLSPKTVSTYRYRLFEKLNVNNDVALTRLAIRYGLLGGDGE